MVDFKNVKRPTGKPQQAEKPEKKGWGIRGNEIKKTMDYETELAKDRRQSSNIQRFRLAKGEEAEVIFLDTCFDDFFGLYEHEIWPQMQKFPSYEISPDTEGIVEDPLKSNPVVNGESSNPYFVSYATILDLRGYEGKDKDGNAIWVPYTRKLLPIKSFQGQQFMNLSDACIDDFGTLRGVKMKLVRPDTAGITSRIGDPQPIGTRYQHLTDAQLIKEYGHPAVVSSRDNKIIIPANGRLQAFDYESIFVVPRRADGSVDWAKHVEKLCRKYRIGAVMGSKQEIDEAWGDAVNEDMQEEQAPDLPRSKPAQGAAKSKGGKRLSSEDLLTDEDIPF